MMTPRAGVCTQVLVSFSSVHPIVIKIESSSRRRAHMHKYSDYCTRTNRYGRHIKYTYCSNIRPACPGAGMCISPSGFE